MDYPEPQDPQFPPPPPPPPDDPPHDDPPPPGPGGIIISPGRPEPAEEDVDGKDE